MSHYRADNATTRGRRRCGAALGTAPSSGGGRRRVEIKGGAPPRPAKGEAGKQKNNGAEKVRRRSTVRAACTVVVLGSAEATPRHAAPNAAEAGQSSSRAAARGPQSPLFGEGCMALHAGRRGVVTRLKFPRSRQSPPDPSLVPCTVSRFRTTLTAGKRGLPAFWSQPRPSWLRLALGLAVCGLP